MTDIQISNKIYEYYSSMFPDSPIKATALSEADATYYILNELVPGNVFGIRFESIYKNSECIVNEESHFYLQNLLQLIQNELFLYKIKLLEE